MSRPAWVGIALALALAGCEAGGAGNALGLCTTVCRCAAEGALPSQQRACVDECVADGEAAEATRACEECVFRNSSSCTDLIEVCFAGGPCNAPDPEPPFPGGPDAGIPPF